jgi:hypothetical protein
MPDGRGFIVPRPTEPDVPVVERPDSVTHFTCPQGPSDHTGRVTHHMTGMANRCAYCKVDAETLRARYGLNRS